MSTQSFTGSSNGTTVLDANGNEFYFSSSNGCMYQATSNDGPTGFCLTASASSSSGFAAYGPTNCTNPTTNSDCDVASFAVALTNNPVNSQECIAVLTTGSATSTYVGVLSE
ncbi:MAG: hypothetical protein ABSA39_17600 [Edaphobacter sp.]